MLKRRVGREGIPDAAVIIDYFPPKGKRTGPEFLSPFVALAF